MRLRDTQVAALTAMLWLTVPAGVAGLVALWRGVLGVEGLVDLYWAAVALGLFTAATLWSVECFRGAEQWVGPAAGRGPVRILWRSIALNVGRWVVGEWLLWSAALHIALHRGWLVVG